MHELIITPFEGPIFFDLFFSYHFVALSLNDLLTLMMIIRIIWYRRNFQNVVGTSAGVSGLYTTVITILVESCAPYTVACLLYLVPTAAGSDISFVFEWAIAPFQVRTVFALPLACRCRVMSNRDGVQVIAPYLIILRVANRKALTSDMLSSGSGAARSIRFASQRGSTGGDESLPDGDPVGSIGMNDEVSL